MKLFLSILFLNTLIGLSTSGSCKLRISKTIYLDATSKFHRFGQALINRRNVEYFGIIGLGRPAQSFKVVLDTGSRAVSLSVGHCVYSISLQLWIPTKGCRSIGSHAKKCSEGRDLFDPDKSKTINSTGEGFSIRYGTGSVSGTLYRDYFIVSTIQAVNRNRF